MAGGIDWFRWHHGSVNDQKFRLIAKKAGARVAEVVAVWACLLEEASASEDRGNAGSPDFESIDEAMGLEDGCSQAIYRQMQERDLIHADGRIVAWERRQPKREREGDSSTERVRAFRERKRQETPGNATERQDEPGNAEERQETPRGEESREEKKKEEISPRKRGARTAPDSFTVTEEMKDWAALHAPMADLKRETEKFQDWEFKDSKTDWPKAWRNWMRRASDDAVTKAAANTGETLRERRARERVEEMTGGLVSAKPPGQPKQPGVFDVPLALGMD